MITAYLLFGALQVNVMLINEMALPSGKDKRKFWYHGTPGDKDSGKKLNSIVKNGIKPGNLTTNRFGWSPIENAVDLAKW